MRAPTKAQRDALTRAYAIYREASKPTTGVSARKLETLYGKYKKALDRVLEALQAHRLSDENQEALETAATRWWFSQVKRGPGKHW